MVPPWGMTRVTQVFHGALAVLIAAAVVWQVVVNLDVDRSLVNLFSYFTIQSNLLVMVGAAGVALDPHREGRVFGAVRLAGLVGITVTGVVYSTVLAGNLDLTGADVVLDAIFHYVVPAGAIIGFVLIWPRTPLDRTSWCFLAWPVAWLTYTLVRAEVGDPRFRVTETTTAPVPYGFLDAGENGAVSVTIACLGVTAFAVVLGAVYLWLAPSPTERDSSPRRSAPISNG